MVIFRRCTIMAMPTLRCFLDHTPVISRPL